MRIPKKITAAWLERRTACPLQVDDFAQEWPKGAALTRENLRRAAMLDLDLWWLAEELLNEAQYDALGEATEPAWKRYNTGAGGNQARKNYYTKLANGLADAVGLP